MGSKKTTTAAGLPALKIGGRVRRTDDGVSGRIVWANGVSVKITWDDGEQVTWRRDSLADRPIEILADDKDPPAPAAAPEPTEPAQGAARSHQGVRRRDLRLVWVYWFAHGDLRC